MLGGGGMIGLNLGEVRWKYLTLKPVRGYSFEAMERACAVLHDGADSLPQWNGVSGGFAGIADALRQFDRSDAVEGFLPAFDPRYEA